VPVEPLSAKVQFSCRTETSRTVLVCLTEAKNVLPAAFRIRSVVGVVEKS